VSPTPSAASLIAATADADLAAVTRFRLPDHHRLAAVEALLEPAHLLRQPYKVSFELGYTWAKSAQLFLVDADLAKMDELAETYRRRGRDAREAGSVLAEAVYVAQQGRSVFTADTAVQPSPDAAFQSVRTQLDALEPDVLDQALSNCFHLGCAFFAAETRILLHLRFLDRVGRARRLSSLRRWTPRHLLWRLRGR